MICRQRLVCKQGVMVYSIFPSTNTVWETNSDDKTHPAIKSTNFVLEDCAIRRDWWAGQVKYDLQRVKKKGMVAMYATSS